MSRPAAIFASVLTVLSALDAHAVDQIDIVIDTDAPQLEQVAAQELTKLLPRLFHDVIAHVVESPRDASRHTILVGSPDTNSRVKHTTEDPWPTGDQTVVIRSRKDRILVIGGGSPAATLWAAYEFGYVNGVRYTLTSDIFPLAKRELDLNGYDVAASPLLRDRRFQIFSPALIGLQSSPVVDQMRLLQQLAKLRFNGIMIEVAPWHPFVAYEFNGVSKQSALMLSGKEFRIDRDTVGKKAFPGEDVFRNRDVSVAAQSSAEQMKHGIKYLKHLMASAHGLGMTVTLRLSRSEAPREFKPVLPGAVHRTQWGQLTVAPEIELTTWDDAWSKILRTRRDAWLKTYPDIDRLAWSDEARFNSSGHDVVYSVLRRSIAQLRPNVQPIDPGPGAVVQIPRPGNCRELVLPLASDAAGVLPQASLQSVGSQIDRLKELGWRGFVAKPVGLAELDSTALLFSRSGWEECSPRKAHDDLWAVATGNAAAAERLWLAWDHLEKATRLVSANDPAFGAPMRGMLTRHYVGEPVPEWWDAAKTHYTQYMIELYRAHGAIDGGAKPLLFYSAKRGAFVLEYFGAIEAVRAAGLARKAGENDQALEHLGEAVELAYNCINTLSDVARDQSDRAAIAVMNEYAFQPLLEELEALESE